MNECRENILSLSAIQFLSAPVMSFSKPVVMRKVGDEHRQFLQKWETEYYFVEHSVIPTCLICMDKVAVHKKYIRRHYSTKHADEYAKYLGRWTWEISERTGLPNLKHVY